MLTGDKGETANNIAISCGLIDPDRHDVFEIRESSESAIEREIDFIMNHTLGNRTQNVVNAAQNKTVPSINAERKDNDEGEVEMVDLNLNK